MSLYQVKYSFYLQNTNLLVHSDHKPLLKIFRGHTDNDKCKSWGLDATAIPRHVKVQHIKGIANDLADSMWRLRGVGLYQDFDFKDHQQEFSAPFEPLPPVEPATHMSIEVNEIFITPNIEKWTQNFNALHDLPTTQADKARMSLENVSPADIPHLEQNLMSLPELAPDKVIKLQKNDSLCRNILQHIHCNKNDNYFIDATGILHKKVTNFNSTFSAMVKAQSLVKYLLHASHYSLGHIGATELYHFLKRLFYFQGTRKKIHRSFRSCHKCQIMNWRKSHFIN